MFKTTKKLAVASAVAMMFAGSAHAINFDDLATSITAGITTTTGTPTTVDSFANVTTGLQKLMGGTTVTTLDPVTGVTTTTVALPGTISAIGGAINTAVINGAIDISGTNVSLSAMAANVSATASALNGTAAGGSSEAFAIAGAKLGTTVIGAMNSSTLDIMAKTSDLGSSATSGLDVASLSGNGANTFATPAVGVNATASGLEASLGAAAGALVSTGDVSLAGFSSLNMNDMTSKITELQAMNVFNGAVNVASLDAGIKIAGAVDAGAWFLNPQTGVVNLSNIAMTTTAIGAMNSSITRLGVNLAK